MDPQDTAPDSWEQEDDVEAPAVDAEPQASFTGFNVNAAVFVPSFFQGGPSVNPVSDGKFMWRRKKHRLDSFFNTVFTLSHNFTNQLSKYAVIIIEM